MLVSIIITTKNEEKNIENCLNSIRKQTYPLDQLEIIVVDNNSIDKTVEIVKGYKEATLKLEKLYNFQLLNWGPERSAQRNFGVEKSSGEWFLYLDADMILSENVIKDCVERTCPFAFNAGKENQENFINKSSSQQTSNINLKGAGGENNSNIVGLHISEIIMGEKFFSQVRRFERSFYDGTVIDGVRFIKKSAFQQVGGFDEKLTGPEDWDLDKKLKGVGKLELVKTPIYHNEAEFDLRKYLSKKGYYAQKFDDYINKWGKDDADIKKQFGIYYRFLGVFVEKGKFKKLLAHPILFFGIMTLRLLVGFKFITRKK